jgi:WD40 repeat protein
MNIVREQFLDKFPRWICHLPERQDDWSSSLQTLEGHSRSVRTVAFSSDAKFLASASDDRIVRLWDATTGAPRGVLEGH